MDKTVKIDFAITSRKDGGALGQIEKFDGLGFKFFEDENGGKPYKSNFWGVRRLDACMKIGLGKTNIFAIPDPEIIALTHPPGMRFLDTEIKILWLRFIIDEKPIYLAKSERIEFTPRLIQIGWPAEHWEINQNLSEPSEKWRIAADLKNGKLYIIH